MKQLKISQDGTVQFLPHRLNRQPIIVRGLTANELWFIVAVAGIAGVLAGIPIAIALTQFALLPSTVLIFIALGVFVGGGFIRRLKRNRPETYLYRLIQWHTRLKYPVVAGFIGGNALIIRSGYWTTKRSR
ncbi:hypothetical protein CUZ56_01358 [Saezia sanguinis]|uniref:TIGR03750 family conjugal transfer protein n=1 Tax=Saezia sanguinis TaxID=1965230 RepID=A0A433SF90_9BURK|nr:TIGR03750 family conjugal transfer protein [Saezia sanguinis]RUS67413.1 hypothetical protein CUZ56_01358 [Saezia sanguinis]